VISQLVSILDQSGILRGALESKSLFEGKYPKGVGVEGKFVSTGHSLGSRVHNCPPPGVFRLNGMHIVKVKPKLFFVANEMSQNHLNRCSSSSSSRKMLPFSSKSTTNVAKLLFSKQSYTHELKEQIKGLKKVVAHIEVEQ
jgi:hypothetical protein